MINFALLPTLLALINSSGINNVNFDSLPVEEKNYIIECLNNKENDLFQMFDYSYFETPTLRNQPASETIKNLPDYLDSNYSDYTWNLNLEKSCSIIDVSGSAPINLNEKQYYKDSIYHAIDYLDLSTSYGGCGNIAMIGILDYFSRGLNYFQIINDVESTIQKNQLCIDVLGNTETHQFGDLTWTFPFDYSASFNNLIDSYFLGDRISSTWLVNFLNLNTNILKETLKTQIQKGLPVTIYTFDCPQYGSFSNHYSNIFAYETWTGSDGNNEIELTFLKGRINNRDDYNNDLSYYCNIDILEGNYCGIITYDFINENNQLMPDSFFSQFVNNNNQGQYFYYEKSEVIDPEEENYKWINTKRLRCSYIENEYLVLSPKRNGAGTAYLEIEFQSIINYLSFDIGIWGYNEDTANQDFKIQYYENSSWNNHIEIGLGTISPKNKDFLTNKKIRFKQNIRKFRFITNHNNPNGDSNKGRIVLDNINVFYG